MCPNDPYAYFGMPDLFTPFYDEVHISTTFTWGIERAYKLANEWRRFAKRVKIDGPAFNNRGNNFKLGMYLRKGVTITSRGCPKKCDFCFVPKREGKIKELPIVLGNIIQDNNLLACSKTHINKVFAMLKTQKHIDFPGGLDVYYITDKIVEQLRGLRIYQLWLSFDKPHNEKVLKKAVRKLSQYFRRDQIRCYVLIGYEGDTIELAKDRLKLTWEIGTLPFAMLYRNENGDSRSKEWRRFQRLWTRPAIIKSIMKNA